MGLEVKVFEHGSSLPEFFGDGDGASGLSDRGKSAKGMEATKLLNFFPSS